MPQLITLGKKLKKNASVMNMIVMYLFASMKFGKGHKKLLGSSFKITPPLWYFTLSVEMLYGTVD